MKRFVCFVYGVVSYAAFFLSFLYLIAFVGASDVMSRLAGHVRRGRRSPEPRA